LHKNRFQLELCWTIPCLSSFRSWIQICTSFNLSQKYKSRA